MAQDGTALPAAVLSIAASFTHLVKLKSRKRDAQPQGARSEVVSGRHALAMGKAT